VLQLRNSTPFKAALMVLPDRHGVETLFTVIKGTFSVGATVDLAPEQLPIVAADEYYGDQLTTSIRLPSDISLEKPGTDVVVIGTAFAPRAEPTWQMDVSASVGALTKSVRVFADRRWDATATGATISWQAPFVRMPIVWERAFGGTDVTDDGERTEPRNPAGVGFRARGGKKPVAGEPLPNIENMAALISSVGDAPDPAGLAPVAPHWLPRRSYAGTYDAQWQRARSPFLPDDFDPRFCQIAPNGMSTTAHIRGAELVELRGLTPEGLMRFALPVAEVKAHYRFDRTTEVRTANLDTVLLEPDESRVVLVWRAALACDKKVLKVRDVETTTAALGSVCK
jgi:hypothetical protein